MSSSQSLKLTIDDGSNLRHVGRVCLYLSSSQSDHEAPSSRSSDNDLVTYPLAGRCVLVHGVEKSCSDGGEGSSANPEDWRDPNLGQGDPLADGDECKRYDECQHLDARPDRSGIGNALEVDGKVVLMSISLSGRCRGTIPYQYSEVCAGEEEPVVLLG